VPTDGFYEWAKVAGGKQPYRITMKDGEPFAMAGLWEWWRRGEQRIESFSIIVTAANELCRPIHDRMPVILHPDTWDAWLTTKDAETASALLQPYPASRMTMYPVSKRVGKRAER
jgi:putative SOS response-associated peptidase YedK